jgi:hypothetical protein
MSTFAAAGFIYDGRLLGTHGLLLLSIIYQTTYHAGCITLSGIKWASFPDGFPNIHVEVL